MQSVKTGGSGGGAGPMVVVQGGVPNNDPFAAEAAAASAAKQAQEARDAALPRPAPSAPPKPSAWDRVAGIFAKKKVDAKARYLQLLRKSELDGRELSDREVSELAHVMETADITAQLAQEHRALIQRHKVAVAAAAEAPQVLAEIHKATAESGEIDRKIAALAEARAKIGSRRDDAYFRHQNLNTVGNVEATAQSIRDLFGE